MLMNENTKLRLGYLGAINGDMAYENARINPDVIIDLFMDSKPNEKISFDTNKEYFKVKRNGKIYYFFEKNSWFSAETGVEIFIDLPLVENDDVFKWEYRHWKSVTALWTQLTRGNLKFNCTYNCYTKETSVNVFWGRNSDKSLGSFTCKNADNIDILKGIEKFLTEFMEALQGSMGLEIKSIRRYASSTSYNVEDFPKTK